MKTDGGKQDMPTRSVSRREFLKLAGFAGATIGLGSGLGGFLAACGGGEATTTTAAGAGTTVSAGTETTAATTVTTMAATTATTAATGPVKGGTLIVGAIGNSADTLDPNLVASTGVSDISIQGMYDTLVWPDTDKLVNHPVLAEELSMQDASTWVIKLRQGATFHNGKPVTADDVIFSLTRANQPGTFASGFLTGVDNKNMEKVDAQTVKLHLSTPNSMLDQGIWQVWIVPTDYDPKNPVGSGPYKLDSFNPGTKVSFKRYDGYWNSDTAFADTVIVQAFADDVSRVNALIGGQIDVAGTIEYPQYQVVKDNKDLQVLNYASAEFYTLNMNLQKPPFTDVRARQACRLLTNRQAIVDQVFAGLAMPADDLYCPLDPNFAGDLPKHEYDPEKALALMKEAGMDTVPIVCSTANTAPSIVEVATLWAQQATEAGLTAKADKLDPSVYFDMEQYMNRQMSTGFWPGMPMGAAIGGARLPTSPFNNTHWNDEEFNALWGQACAEVDPAKRKEYLHQMQVIEHDRGTWLIPVYPNLVDVYSAKVGGIVPLPATQWTDTRLLWVKA